MSTPETHELHLGLVLKRAQHAFRTTVDTRLRPIGLTAPQHAILAAVAADAGISNATLSRIAFVTPQTMQGILSNMVRDGFLTRTPHPQNRRVLQTALTEDGKRALEKSINVVEEIERQIICAVGEENAEIFSKMLVSCAEALSAQEK